MVTIADSEKDFYTLDPRIKRVALGLDSESRNLSQAIFHNARRLHALRKILKEQTPDVAVSMMSGANILLALAALGLPIKTVGSERIHPPTFPIGPIWEWLRRSCYRHLDALVAQTETSRLWLEENTSVRQVKVIATPAIYQIPCRRSEQSPLELKSQSGTSRMLLTLGRFVEQKGQKNLISVFSKLAPRCPDW